jgi:hypothetical protein
MSSETSTDARGLGATGGARADGGFQPWQLFTLAALISGSIVAFYAGFQPPAVRIALIGTVFAAAIIGVAALRTLAPFTLKGGPAPPPVVGGRTRAALEREKTLALRSIKELEFDRAMGKLSEKDFTEMSARLRARAGRLLRELDAHVGYRGDIEQELTRRLAASAPQPSAAAAPHTSDAGGGGGPDAALPDDSALATAAACATCGTRNDADARFCKECGTRLQV